MLVKVRVCNNGSLGIDLNHKISRMDLSASAAKNPNGLCLEHCNFMTTDVQSMCGDSDVNPCDIACGDSSPGPKCKVYAESRSKFRIGAAGDMYVVRQSVVPSPAW